MVPSSRWHRLKSRLFRRRKGVRTRHPRLEHLERRDLLAAVNDRIPDHIGAPRLSRDEEAALFFGNSDAQNANDGIRAKEGSLRKVGFDLAVLHGDHAKFEELTATTVGPFIFAPRNPLVKVSASNGVVIDVLAEGNVESLKSQLADIGMQITGTWQQLISGVIPIDAIDELAALNQVRTARPFMAVASAGAAMTQGDAAQRSDELRSTLGVDGTGITVGILSDSYDSLGDAAGNVASGDLPGVGNPNGWITPVQVLSENSYGGSDEGRAMAQVIHDVAPGANLAFATAALGQAAFAQRISDLRTFAGADIIVDDILYYAEPFFQDGIIAQAVNDAYANGVAYISAAGNNGSNSYESDYRGVSFHPFDSIPNAPGAPKFTGGTTHDFDPGSGVDEYQDFTLVAGQSITLSFQWDQPFASVTGGAGASTDMDIFVLNNSGEVVAGSIDYNKNADPVEVLTYTNPSGTQQNYKLLIIKRSGSDDPGRLKYVNFTNGGPGMGNLEYDTASSTLFGHANTYGALAVGAASWNDTPRFGVSPPALQTFTSQGGTEIRFDSAGNELATFVVHEKPDVVAPDGGNNTFFGSDTDADSLPNFYGTSAAAAHAAGAAALIADTDRAVSPAEIYAALRGTAIDMEGTGFDVESGYGLVDVVSARNEIAPLIIPRALPYEQDFASGLPNESQGWEFYSDNTGSVEISAGRLLMHSTTGGSFSLNEAVLHVDLRGVTNVQLSFDHESERGTTRDEDHPLPNTFSGQQNGDGVAVSVDGQEWVRVISPTSNFTGTIFPLDGVLASAIALAGGADLSDVRIKFQQYDNDPAPFDGRYFDNIRVEGNIPRSLPYEQDFASGLPNESQGWEYYSNNAGSVELVDGRLLMHSTTGGSFSLNEAVLRVDLRGMSDVRLSFDHESGRYLGTLWKQDENDPLPDTFTGHYNGDGVALSVDGQDWFRVFTTTSNFSANSKNFALDGALALALASAPSNDLSDVRIKFQQFDNDPAPHDGRYFDNIRVEAISPQLLPYEQDFANGLPRGSEGWEFYSSNTGSVAISNGRLLMHTPTSSSPSLNEAVLHVDLRDMSDVLLSFDHVSEHGATRDEDLEVPDTSTGHQNGDGVAVSVDGQNWVEVFSPTSNFTGMTLPLDALLVTALGLVPGADLSDVRIKFQQYDNDPFPFDGRYFDNIGIVGVRRASAGDVVQLRTNAETVPGRTYQWTQTSGPTVVLTGADQPTASFTALATLVDHDLTFDITVGDSATISSDTVTISVAKTGDVQPLAASRILDASTWGDSETYSRVGYVFGEWSDEFIPVDVSRSYVLSGTARSGNEDGSEFDPSNRQYFGFASYDIQGLPIGPEHAYHYAASETTLAAPLQTGDTVVTLASTTGWSVNSSAFDRVFAWYGYPEGAESTYPDYTYTRNLFYDTTGGASGPGAWRADNVTSTTIELTSPWNGPLLPAGTAVANHYFTSSFNYSGLSNGIVPNDWTSYEATISGVSTVSANKYKFRAGTAFVKPLLLPNQTGASNRITWKDVEFTNSAPEPFHAGENIDLHINTVDFPGPVTYQWTQISGPAVTLTNDDQPTASFTALTTIADHDLTFDVTVSDGATILSDTVTVSVAKTGDVASQFNAVADFDRETLEGEVTIAPVNSPNPVTYSWTQTRGPDTGLFQLRERAATFIAPKRLDDYELDFVVTISDGLTEVATTVTVYVAGVDPVARFRLEALDLQGNPISSTEVGEQFLVQVYAQDLRQDAQGVYAAYLDIDFNAQLASAVAITRYAGEFPLSPAGALLPGLIDEAGGRRSVGTPTDGAERLLFVAVLRADAPGTLVLQGDPTEDLPYHDVLLFGSNFRVDTDYIDYGSATLEILPGGFVGATTCSPGGPLTLCAEDLVISAEGVAPYSQSTSVHIQGDAVSHDVVISISSSGGGDFSLSFLYCSGARYQ